MMKYIFCIIALLIQPVFSWYVYHKQDKKKAALKMPMLYYSVAYMVVQLYVFFKFCSKFPERYSIYSYLIQAAILVGFGIFEMILWGNNQYIEDVDNKEKQSIQDFKELIKTLEICSNCDCNKRKNCSYYFSPNIIAKYSTNDSTRCC